MVEHRTPRAHLQSEAIGEDASEAPAVSPFLVEYLEAQFPVQLSPPLHNAEATLKDQAIQRGRHEVIDLLRRLSNRE